MGGVLTYSFLPKLSSGHPLAPGQPDYHSMSFPKSKGKFSYFSEKFPGLGGIFLDFLPQFFQALKFALRAQEGVELQEEIQKNAAQTRECVENL